MRTSILCIVLAISACTSSEAPTPAARVERRGRTLSALTGIPLAQMLKAPESFGGKTVIVEGKVRRACQRRGCWMELASSLEKDAAGCRITFKDYGFFVPLDAAGSDARVEGVVSVRKVRKEDVAHLESEGARFAHKEPDGSAHEVRMVAVGVELRRR